MSEFFDYNPEKGLRYDTDYDPMTGKITLHTSQDVQPSVDWATKIRHAGARDKGIKNELWHYCTIPTHVELELRQKGLNIYDKNCTKDLLREINTNYPHLKMTRKHHE
jgi:hypothetical protein